VRKLSCILARVLAVIMAVLLWSSLVSIAHAATHTNGYDYYYSGEGAAFWDSNYYSFFDINGTLGLDVTGPPLIKTSITYQDMYVDVPNGAIYGQNPGTYDTANDDKGNFIGTYDITSSNCVEPGYPDSSDCGANNSIVAPSHYNNCPPVTVYHHWVVVDGGVAVGSGSWQHIPNPGVC